MPYVLLLTILGNTIGFDFPDLRTCAKAVAQLQSEWQAAPAVCIPKATWVE